MPHSSFVSDIPGRMSLGESLDCLSPQPVDGKQLRPSSGRRKQRYGQQKRNNIPEQVNRAFGAGYLMVTTL